jgi:hypothetical protein
MPPTRAEFQRLTDIRKVEVAALLTAGCWDGAYYLAGYVVECALKACIAKRTRAEEFPPPRKVVEQCYTHDLDQLVKSAGLAAGLSGAIKDPRFNDNWSVVQDWAEEAHYMTWTEGQARALWDAINDPNHGYSHGSSPGGERTPVRRGWQAHPGSPGRGAHTRRRLLGETPSLRKGPALSGCTRGRGCRPRPAYAKVRAALAEIDAGSKYKWQHWLERIDPLDVTLVGPGTDVGRALAWEYKHYPGPGPTIQYGWLGGDIPLEEGAAFIYEPELFAQPAPAAG